MMDLTNNKDSRIIENKWDFLKKYTDARIALGRVGVSIPTRHLLDFQLAHAQAQDAVHLALDTKELLKQLATLDVKNLFFGDNLTVSLHSKAETRTIYLQRPDLGRVLNSSSKELLIKNSKNNTSSEYDLSIVIVDGLSSLAIKENAFKYIEVLLQELKKDDKQWNLSSLTVVQQGRVAIGDEIGEILKSKLTLVLIGERPGLSSPDSLGLYLTWRAKIGLSDVHRNCISNIRADGLSYSEAVRKTMYLLKEARKLELSGINLKDRTSDDILESSINNHNFLIQ